jgi:DNA-binding CsgD family transcriptional regulator/tetratricopeptide (TPR) repeat protein
MPASDHVLYGRTGELQTIAGVLDTLCGDAATGLSLQLAGEPGIGKSRLLHELGRQARDRGHLVLAGRAAEFDGELPFGLFADAMDDWLRRLPRERLAEVAGDLAAELAVVLPAFDVLVAERRAELPEERYRAYRAMRLLLATIATEVPVVLLLDDLQWADPGSVELVAHLLAHPPPGPVLPAMAFRPAQIPPLLHGALAAALRDQQATRLEPALLRAADAHALLGHGLPRPLRTRLFRESGGNPFFLLQLARGVRLGEAAGRSAAVTSAIPAGVRNALASELTALSPPAQTLLQGAAVVGDPFDEQLAAIAADVGEPESLVGIDELVESALVAPAPSEPGSFSFRHPIVRATVYESAGGGWRTRAHVRVADALAARGAGAPARAPHVERAARPGDVEAVDLLAAAGQQTAPRAPALAARWYRGALRLLPDGPAAEPRRIELLIAMATALGSSGQLEASHAALCEVLERLPADGPGRVAIIAYCAGVEHLLGRHRDANARLARGHAAIADGASRDAVAMKLELAAGGGYENRAPDMEAWAEQALAGAEALDDRALQMTAAGEIALARYFRGRPAAAHLDRAVALLDTIDDAGLARRLDVGLWIGWTEAVLERHDDAIAHCQRVVDVARATGQGAPLLVTMTAQAWALIRSGRLDEADEVLAAAVEAGRLAPNLFLSVAVGLASVVATYRGRYDEALRAGEECVALASAADPGLIPGMSGLYLATPLIEMGDARRARAALLVTSHAASELSTSRSGHAAAYEILTRADIALGRADAAHAWAQKAVAAAHGGELAGESAFAQRAVAHVALAGGDAAGAAAIALGAAERVDGAGMPGEAGRCRILAARALARSDRRVEAVAELERAVEALGAIGADGYRAEAEKELRRLGRRVRRAGAERGLESLTEREREIAAHVSRGRTNREIAAASYLSERTVERHLSHVFAKLGVSSRAAVASIIAASEGER